MDVDGVEFTVLRVFMHGVRADALAWSPESRLDKLPQMIRCFITTLVIRHPTDLCYYGNHSVPVGCFHTSLFKKIHIYHKYAAFTCNHLLHSYTKNTSRHS